MCNNLSWSAAEASAEKQGKSSAELSQLEKFFHVLEVNNYTSLGTKKKKASERVSDQLTECNVKPWVSVEAAKHRAKAGEATLTTYS